MSQLEKPSLRVKQLLPKGLGVALRALAARVLFGSAASSLSLLPPFQTDPTPHCTPDISCSFLTPLLCCFSPYYAPPCFARPPVSSGTSPVSSVGLLYHPVTGGPSLHGSPPGTPYLAVKWGGGGDVHFGKWHVPLMGHCRRWKIRTHP